MRPGARGPGTRWSTPAWALWLVGLFAARAATGESRHAETADEPHEAVRTMLICDALDIVAAVLALAVVLRLPRMQEHKVRSGEVPFPAPVPG
ncbi:DUF4328 domain-containing protein [Streptomyces sp. SCL15-4]|uniref:DUF4328 domain-containing protein n=1 Tax=Streptomyces sp. SCL15-4 TaxID=2967221 RepID=UPI0029666153|nr:DUF4328 domain-containing protein [Streptomyces sp. SCL15-4]